MDKYRIDVNNALKLLVKRQILEVKRQILEVKRQILEVAGGIQKAARSTIT